MKFKIDTKEKFSIITPNIEILYAIITEELMQAATNCLQTEIKNVILNLKNITDIDEPSVNMIENLQQQFYESNASFVVCEMKNAVEKKLDDMELLDIMNTTPTESEAYDIVQMEEIERELLDSDDMEFEAND
jgi:anti-anti-sigma factor